MKKQTLLFGMTQKEIVEKTGISWGSVWHHAHGERRISPKNAIIYHEALGIPLEELRPDIWGENVVNNLKANECDGKRWQATASDGIQSQANGCERMQSNSEVCDE